MADDLQAPELAAALAALGQPDVSAWLAEGRGPLVVRRDGSFLLVERAGEPPDGPPGLTPRERDVLRCVARGLTNAEIAAVLWVSPGTVRKHLEHAFAKLGVRTRTAAAARFALAGADQPVSPAQAS